MKVIVRPRQSGKTMELIKQASESGAYIVTFSMAAADCIFRTAKESGYKIHLPITFRELFSHHYGRYCEGGWLIDNLDICLQGMTPYEIHTVTFTENEKVEESK